VVAGSILFICYVVDKLLQQRIPIKLLVKFEEKAMTFMKHYGNFMEKGTE
jgi:hypothetical protein